MTASASLPAPLRAFTTGAAPASEVRAWRTSKDEEFKLIEAPVWESGLTASAMSIRLDPNTRCQEVLGFGAALTEASCSLLGQLDAEARRKILEDCFGPNGLRLSVGRTTIGSSDYSLTAYSYDDSEQPDPQLTHFSIDHDLKYILPVLREARQVNREMFYFSSPWSPPAWMKASHTLLGGAMRRHYFPAYAEYMRRFLEGYAKNGVTIDAITVQNETDTEQDGNMPAALWGQEYEMEFVKAHLGPALEKAGLKTKIWILDHNYDLWGRAVDELSDPEVSKYVDGVAWHGYVGEPSSMTRVHDMFPQKNAYWTEGGPDYTDPAYATDWSKWSSTFTGILRNWARCIVSWNLVLDEKGRPDIGPFSCGGLVTLDSKTHAVTRSGMYKAFAQYSRAMQRGARVIASWNSGGGELPGIAHVAAENPDGSKVMVLTNQQGGEQKMQVLLGDQAMAVLLPPDSVTTVVW
ncbi:MAG TPA: glycoside hydrolase family 30 beta sandwich domain-containing protein [Acidobacteriaceae bacterium]|nr:glycoside hydrolase family 30 beta sandwich domain-containing protein [Acidobacteriaceae bacterium]